MKIGLNQSEKILWCSWCNCYTIHTRDTDEENLIQETAKRSLPEFLVHDGIKIYKCNQFKDHGTNTRS